MRANDTAKRAKAAAIVTVIKFTVSGMILQPDTGNIVVGISKCDKEGEHIVTALHLGKK